MIHMQASFFILVQVYVVQVREGASIIPMSVGERALQYKTTNFEVGVLTGFVCPPADKLSLGVP